MTDLANIPKPSQPPGRSPWSKMIIDSLRSERRESLTQEQRQQFITELAERLSTLRAWERSDRNHLASVTLKRGYQVVSKLEGHTNLVRAVHAVSDGRIISGGDDTSVRIWVPRDGVWCSVSPNEDKSWLGLVRGVFARIWRLAGTGTGPSLELKGHHGYVRAVQALPDGRIVSGSEDSTVRVWAQNCDGAWYTESSMRFSSAVNCLQVLPDGSVVTGHLNGSLIHSHPTPDGAWRQEQIASTILMWALQALPDSRVVTASVDGSVRVFTRGEGDNWRERVISVSDDWLTALQVLPDGRMVVGGVDGYIRELAPNRAGDYEASVVGKHEHWVSCLHALPDGRIVSGGLDKKIRIWTRESSGSWQQERLEVHEGAVRSLQVLQDGRIVSASDDNTIRIWDGTPVSDGGAL